MIVWLDRRVWGLSRKEKALMLLDLFRPVTNSCRRFEIHLQRDCNSCKSANKVLFILAPIITMTLALIAWAVIPMSADFVLADINVGILYLFAVSSLGVYGILLGGCGL